MRFSAVALSAAAATAATWSAAGVAAASASFSATALHRAPSPAFVAFSVPSLCQSSSRSSSFSSSILGRRRSGPFLKLPSSSSSYSSQRRRGGPRRRGASAAAGSSRLGMINFDFDFDFGSFGGGSEEEDGGGGEAEFVPREGKGPNWIEKSSPTGLGPLSPRGGEVSSPSESSDGGGIGAEASPASPQPTSGGGGGGKVDDYSLGISGSSFDTGPLSLRMYTALAGVALKRFPPNTTLDDLPEELKTVYKLYAMDMTAKEAVRAALKQNGLEMALSGEDGGGIPGGGGGGGAEDVDGWGQMEGIHLVDKSSGERIPSAEFDTVREAVELGLWSPGQPFDFVVRNVPAKVRQMDLSELLQALDPDGSLREEVKEGGGSMPDEDVRSLRDLGNECERRANGTPREAEDEATVFRGGPERGYRVIHKRDLTREERNEDGTERRSTLMHVMDALVTHGCLVVDVTDGGADFGPALALSGMWDAAASFFENVVDGGGDSSPPPALPSIDVAEDAGSRHAMVGYASYGEGKMRFLETRLRREEGRALVPGEVGDLLDGGGDGGGGDGGGGGGEDKMRKAFDLVAAVGKDVTRIAVAAVSAEERTFLEEEAESEEDGGGATMSDMPFISGLTFEEAEVSGVTSTSSSSGGGKDAELVAEIRSSEAASLLADELLDDGAVLPPDAPANPDESRVCMSPHRLCRYAAKPDDNGNTNANAAAASADGTKLAEIFGAHTDTSFLTAVPVAEVSGLEVYDETAERWYRPELAARDRWERDRAERLQDFRAPTETVRVPAADNGEEVEVEVPWHCRYVVMMPGELLQLVTRGEVPAAVHRVVAVEGGRPRLSAPVLLRARNGMRMDVGRYLGRGGTDLGREVLEECDGMPMEDVHDAMQPSSFR